MFGRNPWHTSHACCGKCVNRGSPTTCISLILKPYLSASENCISVFSSETDLGNCVTICADDVIDWIYCSCSIITCENDCWMLPFPYFCRSQLLSSLMQQSDYCTITKCEFSDFFRVTNRQLFINRFWAVWILENRSGEKGAHIIEISLP